MPGGKAIRYGITVGEDGQSWAGFARVGNMQEWPSWVPTEGEKQRLGPLPSYVQGGPANPMGARALYLYQGNKDTLFRIHGTNQPEYIGTAISSGCIRMLNEDVIDLYHRVGGTPVIVLNSHLRGEQLILASQLTWSSRVMGEPLAGSNRACGSAARTTRHLLRRDCKAPDRTSPRFG
jgi:hypothetical protein